MQTGVSPEKAEGSCDGQLNTEGERPFITDRRFGNSRTFLNISLVGV